MPEKKKNEVVLFVNRIKIRFIRLPNRSWLSLSLYCLSYLPPLFLTLSSSSFQALLFLLFPTFCLQDEQLFVVFSSALFGCACRSVQRHLYIACSLSFTDCRRFLSLFRSLFSILERRVYTRNRKAEIAN